MYRIGIDIGSTYTKYCIMDGQKNIIHLFSEKTPLRQREYFHSKTKELFLEYPDAHIISCGYGKKNVSAIKNINELTALARGSDFVNKKAEVILDIGGQDTKIIQQKDGQLKKFFVNDKCAAGSGMFLVNICNMLQKKYDCIDLTNAIEPKIKLSSVCAVFAQSEIVELLADNTSETLILQAVIWHILTKSKILLDKIKESEVFLSGGLTQIKGFDKYAQLVLERKCRISNKSKYLSAIGAALYAFDYDM